jgi:hypothetical protein
MRAAHFISTSLQRGIRAAVRGGNRAARITQTPMRLTHGTPRASSVGSTMLSAAKCFREPLDQYEPCVYSGKAADKNVRAPR